MKTAAILTAVFCLLFPAHRAAAQCNARGELGAPALCEGNLWTGSNTFTNRLLAAQSDTTSITTNPFISFTRTTNHAGSPYQVGVVGRTLDVVNSIYGNIRNFEYALNVQAIQNNVITTPQDISALNATGVRALGALGSVNAIWGGNILVIDDTARKSSLSPEYLRGLEVNVSAAGPDDANLRVGADIIMFQRATSVDGASSHYAGVRVIPASAFGNNFGQPPVTIKNGFVADRFGTSGVGDLQVAYAGNASIANFVSQAAPPTVAAFYANHEASSSWNALIVGPSLSPVAKIQGDGAMFGKSVDIVGDIKTGGSYYARGFKGVDCPAGSVSLLTVVVVGGTITHC